MILKKKSNIFDQVSLLLARRKLLYNRYQVNVAWLAIANKLISERFLLALLIRIAEKTFAIDQKYPKITPNI